MREGFLAALGALGAAGATIGGTFLLIAALAWLRLFARWLRLQFPREACGMQDLGRPCVRKYNHFGACATEWMHGEYGIYRARFIGGVSWGESPREAKDKPLWKPETI